MYITKTEIFLHEFEVHMIEDVIQIRITKIEVFLHKYNIQMIEYVIFISYFNPLYYI